ncbi:class I SAM-dependent methyltransferase [Paenibacillus sp. FSL R10-2736]|uniref:class I SAM-dependent methyltransferase n=1 Tax=Paenibacillus sp. FSL R10-2736 TaxID=2954692 RepID=UPI0030FAC820
MKNSAFDQYQRYNNIRNIINEMRCDNEKYRILEVGANEHRKLEKFLPLDNITYLDIQLPEELQKDPSFILGDATDMDFPDGEYDVIVALDVFEHIPSEKRNRFIEELYRVCSQICIITAPFYSMETVDAESRVNSIYNSLFEEDYIWLAEHKENGLPNEDALKEYLHEKNMKFKIAGHGRLNIWEKLIGFHFFAAKYPELTVYRQEIDKFYNSHIFDYDYTEDSYRKIVVLEKGRELNLSFGKPLEIPAETLEKLDAMERTFYNLCSMLDKNKETNLKLDKVQIFIDLGQGYNELNSKNFQFNDNELNKTAFVDLRGLGVIKSIRIDPSDYSGCYKIENLRVIRAFNETVIKHRFSGNFELEDFNIYFFEKDDPNIILSLESEMELEGFEIQIKKLTMGEIINHYVNTLSIKESEILAINDVSKLQLAMKDTHINNLNNDKHKMEGQMKKCTDEIEKFENKLSESSQVIANLKIENTANEAKKHELMQQLAEKEQELINIYNSKAWKFVTKARKILGK